MACRTNPTKIERNLPFWSSKDLKFYFIGIFADRSEWPRNQVSGSDFRLEFMRK